MKNNFLHYIFNLYLYKNFMSVTYQIKDQSVSFLSGENSGVINKEIRMFECTQIASFEGG